MLSYGHRMEVFLIPVAHDRYELYCEVPDDDPPHEEASHGGLFRGLVRQFKQALAEAERERRMTPEERAAQPHAGGSWLRRVKRQVMRRIAESIAEQRLLWYLRRQEHAVAVHPEDLPAEDARRVVAASMQSDYDKHRRWLIIDGVFFVLSGLLMLVPGPNVLAYYLGFRLVGHFLSLRGARRGMGGVEWHTKASAPLAELRQALHLDPEEREARVHDIAARLRLERLATFFARTAVPTA